MTPTTTVDLFASALHFHADGEVRAGERQMTGGPAGAWQIGAFHVATDADVHADQWEMHPRADEAVCCLTGGVRLYLRAPEAGGAEELVRLPAGTAVIVPRGRWHRLELDGPSDLMSVTLRQGTRLESR
ncbi:cupin domain-containing protein [Kitasatospora sp. NBC_01287]|uniref:cupin domain-containing protein n=1 Tax=Kitasatospora sp. NBC_01287 TaxID=2903573 RepID=UPI002256B981|nr:cupin domain-containing protein [Kitasatospora sp. NBC_01287]MCX4745915.1 cupin domain-containing protein [Kitasatospora sp. NBC_01287]